MTKGYREIQTENCKYYSSTYSNSICEKNQVISYIYAIILLVFLIKSKHHLMIIHYTDMASGYKIDGEVKDWVMESVGNNFFDFTFFIIIGFVLALIIGIFITFKVFKNYDLYKIKNYLIVIPVVVTIALLGCLWTYIYINLGLNIVLESFGIFLSLFPLLFSSRGLIPLEIKEPYFKIIDWLADILLRRV